MPSDGSNETENPRESEPEMACVGIGKIQEFVPGKDVVEVYLLQLKHFFKANAITQNDRKVSFFITLVGSNVISTLVDLFNPVELDSQTYEVIIEKFKKHFQPERLVVSERHKFYSRRQKPEESISDYAVVIKHLAATCKFNAFLEDALRDRLISGVLHEELRQKLISQELTFANALEEALKFEEANKQKMFLGFAPSGSDVNAIRKSDYQKKKARPVSCNQKQLFQIRCRLQLQLKTWQKKRPKIQSYLRFQSLFSMDGHIRSRIRFLNPTRNTPHTVTGKTPAELFLQRRPRTRLSLLLPMLEDTPKSSSTVPQYQAGETVYVRTVRGEKISWMPGEILQQRGKVTYDVRVMGQHRFCHVDHLRRRSAPKATEDECQTQPPQSPQTETPGSPSGVPVKFPDLSPKQVQDTTVQEPAHPDSPGLRSQADVPVSHESSTPVRRSSRIRKPPDRLTYETFSI